MSHSTSNSGQTQKTAYAFTLFHQKTTLVIAQCDAEKTEYHQNLLGKDMQKNRQQFKSRVSCGVQWALNSHTKGLKVVFPCTSIVNYSLQNYI